jgi:hypothetical protein
VLGGAALALVILRGLFSRWIWNFQSRSRRAALDRALSRVLFAAVAWLVIGALWWAGSAIHENPEIVLSILGLTGTSGGAFAWARKFLSYQPSKPRVGGFRDWLGPLVPQILAYLTLALAAVLCIVLLQHAAGDWEPWARLLPLWVAGGVLAITLFLFNPNEVGLHSFYRVRLARTYLGASNPRWKDDCNRVTADSEADDFPLTCLKAGKPFHLVCCAANDLAGDQIANLYRGAKSAVLSRLGFSVGDRWAPWSGKRGVPSLGAAITASGAAFNSHMGSRSMEWGPAVTFLMSALNLRLGLWLAHPKRWYTEKRVTRWLAGWPFYKELLSWSQAEGYDVHLSDGGHFENLAFYELVRRHCRYILVCDCGADPDVAFDDLGNVVRRVREDFGVEIVIDLTPLRPGPDGLARQPMVAGDIYYPDGDTGVLLVLKPTLVGDEPVDILQYKRRNAAFPHETTGDQFYDEAQWESYRRLGEHAVLSAFRVPVEIAAGAAAAEKICCAQVFARARFEWLPIPAAARENFPRLAARVSELENLLREARCQTLLREVYKEIDELEVQARGGDVVAAQSTSAKGGESGDPEKTAAPAGSAAAALGLSAEELTSSLQVLRVAILFMEEVFFALDLDAQATHPVNLGWINYFARWAYASLFRMWWPLLKGMYAPRFTRFLENCYGLTSVEGPPSLVEDVTGVVEKDKPAGYAWACWLQQQPPPPSAVSLYGNKRVFTYKIAMRFQHREVYRVQAALALVTRVERAAVWDASDFFVPPGLWGMGIGEAFLAALEMELAKAGVRLLVVRVAIPPADRVQARKEIADNTQLYRCAEFREAHQMADSLNHALSEAFGPGNLPASFWFYKEI